MKLSTSLVAVKKIGSSTSRTDFSEEQLEEVAKLILKAEGVINPIILSRTSLESYEVIDGHFEYYAAVKARELDPRKGEMIGAFILEEEKEEAIREQIKAIRESKVSGVALLNNTESAVSKNQVKSGFEQQLESLFLAEMRTIKKEIEQALKEQQKSPIESEKIFSQNVKDELDEIKDFIRKLEQSLTAQFNLIEQELKLINSTRNPQKLNLITVNKEQVSKALKEVKVRENAIEATYQAIEYWRNKKESLTWENLKKSAKDKLHKIPGFGESTYKKLEDIAEIRT